MRQGKGEESEEEWMWASAAVQGRTLLLLLLVRSTSQLHQIRTSVQVSKGEPSGRVENIRWQLLHPETHHS